MAKFMQSLDNDVFNLLNSEAEKRGTKVQELIRTVIVPEWLKKEGLGK